MGPKSSLEPHLDFALELALESRGHACIAGIDEAGRGAWAGPVTAAAVILPLDDPNLPKVLYGVRDSKRMTIHQRERWEVRIREVAQAVGVGSASNHEVDTIGLIAATRTAMGRAVQALATAPAHLLIDHLLVPDIPLPQTALPHGDARVLSIAAASIIAKTSRDREMVRLDRLHPGYGFSAHKGYGTSQHREALQTLGPSTAHRFTYAPVAACMVDPRALQEVDRPSGPAEPFQIE